MIADVTQVRSVYSGSSGCCSCGCKGKYTYASQYQTDSEKSIGYPLSDDQINDRTIKTIFNRVAKNPNHVDDGNLSYLDNGQRIWIVYFD